ncbi:MAG: sugar phosphate isomerase/epimerase [Caldilineales bacterium]|nr:sugar phosphate isomerase/epimerase [Caldilineales bacterium]
MNRRRQHLYVSTACLPWQEPLPDRLAAYRAFGLDAIELGGNVSVTDEALSMMSRTDPPLLVHNYFPPPAESFVLNLASMDETIRTRSLDLVMSGLSLAVRLGAPFYSVHAGFVTDPVGFGETSFLFPSPASPEEVELAAERFLQSISFAARRARELGIEILVENNVCPLDLQGKLLLQTADEMLELFARLDDLPVGMLLDTGHLKVTAATFGFEPAAFVSAVEPFVRCIHVHDNDGVKDLHWPVEADSWALSILKRPTFVDLPIVIESKFAAVEALRQHVEFMRNELSGNRESASGLV